MNKLALVFFVFALLVAPFVSTTAIAAMQLATPLILGGLDQRSLADVPELSGTTPAGSEVLVYVDGIFAGLAETKSQGGGSDSFHFRLAKEIGGGRHSYMVVARDPLSLVLSAPSPEIFFEIKSLAIPTLIMPKRETVIGTPKPLIVGLTKSGSKVQFWIDGIYNGETGYLEHPSGTANFAYRPFLNLKPGGHYVAIRAIDRQGLKSEFSVSQEFRVESPMPAPADVKVVFSGQPLGSPLLVGVAKSGAKVKVFIDNKLNGELVLPSHPSGASGFAYRPFLPLIAGSHQAYVVAVDSRGKESRWSKMVNFRVYTREEAGLAALPPAGIPELSEPVIDVEPWPVEALPEAPEAPVTPEQPVTPEAKPSQPEAPIAPNVKDDTKDIEDILENFQNEASTTTGLVDESNAKQGRLKWNLVIFIIFLIAVIGWIVWVNRELAREKSLGASEQGKLPVEKK